MALAIVMGGSLMFSSCIGSFGLTKKLYSWNNSLGDKWVNELVFFVTFAWVYPIAGAFDIFILNSIEFWTGDNPATAENVKTVKTDKGLFTVTTTAGGHKITKEGSDEIVEFRFNKAENSWSLVANDTNTKLLQFVEGNKAQVYLANGNTMTVSKNFFAKQ
ncbi:hypothetical protein SAMD00024442_107_3 [Candidatus Symbiothrix dinenymphae]|nr:hypothetical protein SAMD00024442_107_3 [Candidatus Symbiothrix dinenymphae]